MKYKTLMIIAPEMFRDEEYLEPKHLFRENNIDVETAGLRQGTAVGRFGEEVSVSSRIEDIHAQNYHAVIFIGGSGCKVFWHNLSAHRLAKETLENDRILAAICSAPVILANAGVIKDKRVTCFPGDAEKVKEQGAIYTGGQVEQDGLIVTADGAQSSTLFAAKIIQALQEVA